MNGNPVLKAPHIAKDDARVREYAGRLDSMAGRPMIKGMILSPPLLTDSGTFGCRSTFTGAKEYHELVINFQRKFKCFVI